MNTKPIIEITGAEIVTTKHAKHSLSKYASPKNASRQRNAMKKSYKIVTATHSTAAASMRSAPGHGHASHRAPPLADMGEQPLTGLDIGNPVDGFSFALVYGQPLDEQALIAGLQRTLARIPYFSGRLFGIGSSLPLVIPNNEGALFISALFEGHLPTFNAERPLKPNLSRFLPAINAFSFGHDTPLLQVQLTHFVNGCILGISISHALCDGASMLGFVQDWANNVLDREPLPLPCWNRRDVQLMAMGTGERPSRENPVVEMTEPFHLSDRAVSTAVFHLPDSFLHALEARYRSSDDSISRQDLITAFIYLLMAHSRAEPESTPALAIACNLRRALQLPANYLGNAVWLRHGEIEREQLQTADLRGIAGHVSRLHREITRDGIREDLAFWQARMAEGSASRFMSIATHRVLNGDILIDNMSRFDFYALDFGAGTPLWLDIPPPSSPAPVTRAVLMMPASPRCGGIHLHVILPPAEMEKLRSQFGASRLASERFDARLGMHSPGLQSGETITCDGRGIEVIIA